MSTQSQLRRAAVLQKARLFSQTAIASTGAIPHSNSFQSFFQPADLKKLKHRLARSNGDVAIEEINAIYDRASKLGFDSSGALFLLSCIATSPASRGHEILEEAILRIEEEYIAGNPQWLNVSSPFTKLCMDSGIIESSSATSFRATVHSLPPECKTLIMGFSPMKLEKPRKTGLTKDEVSARWHNLDPVDMETAEREHFLKTGQQLRTRDVKAKIRPAPVGSRLRQVLGLEFLEQMGSMNVDDFMALSSSLLTAPQNGVFHRDLKMDAQFRMCKKIMGFTLEDIGKNIVSISLILSRFEPTLEIPNRVWNRSVIPAIRKDLCDVSKVPHMHQHLNESSRWALLTAAILSSGRVKATPRLMRYLTHRFEQDLSSIDHSVADSLLSGLVEAGISDRAILKGLSSNNLPVPLHAKLVHTRNHFGVFGVEFELLVDHLVEKIKADPSLLKQMSQSKRVMVLNSIWSSSKQLENPSETIPELTAQVASVLPDLDIEVLGRMDSVLE
jgi:hypothetical protein